MSGCGGQEKKKLEVEGGTHPHVRRKKTRPCLVRFRHSKTSKKKKRLSLVCIRRKKNVDDEEDFVFDLAFLGGGVGGGVETSCSLLSRKKMI